MELKDEILEKIIERAAQIFKKAPGELTAETKFVDDLAAKSVNYVQIITILADAFDADIPFMEFRRKKTLGEAASYVAQLLGE
jgi:acyl carrier protein